MLSTFPAVSSSDGLFGSPFPAFEPWDSQEFLPIFQQFEPVSSPNPNQEPVYSNSGSGSDDSNQRNNIRLNPRENRKRNNSNSGSDDERKRRRMVSNRESARRSRMRKQKHLENLRNQVNRLKLGNRDMVNRLHVVIQHSQMVRRENERLQVESVMLQQKLWDMRQLLLVRQLEQQLSWPCNNNQ